MKIGEWNVSATGLLPNPHEPDGIAKEEPSEEQIKTCMEWIALHASKRKTIHYDMDSYFLKHSVERWTETLGNRYDNVDAYGRLWIGQSGQYIAQGAFIAAALRSGYRVKQMKRGEPNCRFNMTFRKRDA